MSDSINQDIGIHGNANIVVGKGSVVINPLPPAEARLRTELGILLKNVQNTWIKGVLEKSVHEAALLELGMELHADSIDNPWRMVMEKPDQTREVLARGRKIKDIFNEANRLLLILGEPGSGKTTTLLQLARDLIAEVDQSFTQPVPVILNLSTWTNKQQPLDEWLIAELNSKYLLPKKQGKLWLQERRILPLLDGLDEVKAESRAACVEKINQLVVDYGLQGLVVCSRIKDYTALNIRLAFYRAIYLQPLTHEQVDQYLLSAGEKLASLRTTLQNDDALQSLAQSPLILNIMSLAYQDSSAESLSEPSLNTNEARRRHLFDTYIARMFSRKSGPKHYDDNATRHRLSWLARNMQKHSSDVFQIEGLQPSWLPGHTWQWIYIFVSRLISSAVFGTCITYGILLTTTDLVNTFSRNSLLIIALSLPFFGLSMGLPVGFVDILRFEWLRKNQTPVSVLWWLIANTVTIWLTTGLILVPTIFMIPSNPSFTLSESVALGMFFGFFPALFFGIRNSRRNAENDIQTVEALHLSWFRVRISFLISSLIGLGIFWVMNLIDLNGLGVEFVWVMGLTAGIIGGLYGGFRPEIVDTKSLPNQGMQLSIRNALRGGLIGGLIGSIAFVSLTSTEIIIRVFALGESLIDYAHPDVGLLWFDITLIMFISGLIGLLWFGVLDVIQHYTLRLILLIQGHMPRNYVRFLDYTVDRIFLQKVGGGYRFIHRLLLEHFADMYEENGRKRTNSSTT